MEESWKQTTLSYEYTGILNEDRPSLTKNAAYGLILGDKNDSFGCYYYGSVKYSCRDLFNLYYNKDSKYPIYTNRNSA